MSGCVAIEGLEFGYPEGGFRLRIPALEIAPGACVACVGPSGSGKTTFLHLLAGIVLPAHGRVVVEGRELTRAPDAERRRFRITTIGLVFQEFELLEHLSVRENVLLPYFVNPALELDPAVEARARELAGATGIEALLDRRPRALSHGERQRVALCRALVTEPALLLADEPTGNLDPDATRAVLDLILEQTRRRGAALLMATHDHGLLDRFDRVLDFAEWAA